MWIFLFFFASGPKIMGHIVNAEIFPLQLREISYGLCKIMFFTANFIVVQLFPILMTTKIGATYTFITMSINCLISWLLV